jgi:RNA polymerase sigma-70 factor (ECF subfamily)
MDRDRLNQHLSRISTLWSVLLQAHDGPPDAATAAQKVLLQRYSGAAYRYLLGAVRDPDVAGELCQEFALRFLRGDFRRADPERGRFRDYLKTALIHLVTDHHRARQAWPRPFTATDPEPAAPAETVDTDRDFLTSWREELLERTWAALAAANPAYHAVLLCRIEDPDLASAQMAERLTTQLGKPLTADWVRKTQQRAHEKYADLLLEEVACSLGDATPEQLREELRELDLLKYCRSALARRGCPTGSG